MFAKLAKRLCLTYRNNKLNILAPEVRVDLLSIFNYIIYLLKGCDERHSVYIFFIGTVYAIFIGFMMVKRVFLIKIAYMQIIRTYFIAVLVVEHIH